MARLISEILFWIAIISVAVVSIMIASEVIVKLLARAG